MAPRIQCVTAVEKEASDAQVPYSVTHDAQEPRSGIEEIDVRLDVGERTVARQLGSVLPVDVD